jgi:hypothetical protein
MNLQGNRMTLKTKPFQARGILKMFIPGKSQYLEDMTNYRYVSKNRKI